MLVELGVDGLLCDRELAEPVHACSMRVEGGKERPLVGRTSYL